MSWAFEFGLMRNRKLVIFLYSLAFFFSRSDFKFEAFVTVQSKMHAPCADASHNLILQRQLPWFRLCVRRPLLSFSSSTLSVFCSPLGVNRRCLDGKQRAGCQKKVKGKKDNVWSIDNEFAFKSAAEDGKVLGRRRRNMKRVKYGGRRSGDSVIMVSASMLMEIETVLQTQEPVIKPSWLTFTSSISGIWKGVGAVFSPFTAELEPLGVGNQNENLFDCYTLSHIEKVPSQGTASQVHRKTHWVALNPFGEARKHAHASHRRRGSDKSLISGKIISTVDDMELDLPSYESFDLSHCEVLEEDSMSMEPGLIFFEDGSYSRGPVNIPVGEHVESRYSLPPTYRFEQCLVKGCHKRLRIVHTIEFSEGGANLSITRVAVYEEEWVSPVNLSSGGDDAPLDLKPISQRRRTQPSELTGSWKVFEVSATPIFGDGAAEEGGLPFVYLCMETLKKRGMPGSCFTEEEEAQDLNDVTVLWLPGGVTGYVDVNKEGTLCIGFSWYSDEGVNLVMERDYGVDGNLKEVRSKSEVKRRWPESPLPSPSP